MGDVGQKTQRINVGLEQDCEGPSSQVIEDTGKKYLQNGFSLFYLYLLVNHSANDAMRDENYFIYPMFVKLFYACIDGDSLWYEKCSLSVLVPMELSQCEKVCHCLSGKRFRGWSGLFIMDNFLFSILSSSTAPLC